MNRKVLPPIWGKDSREATDRGVSEQREGLRVSLGRRAAPDGGSDSRKGHGEGVGRGSAALLALALAACSPPVTDAFEHRTLAPFAPIFHPGDPLYTPQPHRDRPLRVAVNADHTKAYVTLQGLEDEPGHEVAVVDLARGEALHRIAVGSSPTGIAMHPGGRFAVVTNRYSNWASVIDTVTDRVVRDVPADYYTVDVAFTPDGRRAYLSNRWRNRVVRWDLAVTADRFDVLDAHGSTLPVANHPRDVAINADGTRLAVAGFDGLSVSLFELPTERLISTVNLRASVNDVLFAGDWLFALTLGPGDGHPALEGPDFDEDGRPGDSTANTNFQDQQNDIAVIRAADGHVERRYTTDTTCCRDFRDVDTTDPVLGAFVPPRDLWIVGGSIPEAAALCGSRLYVAYMGSSELEVFDVDVAAGTLHAASRAGTGFAPSAVACAGDSAAVVSSLGETLEVSRASGMPTASVAVGDVSGGRFPATDAEMGEVLNLSTAPFTVDGDQSCVMCHREFGAPDKAFSMPLLRFTDGTRNTMSHRGLADSRPWFFETAMDENNFFPVLNEFARQENFCCTDPTLWNTEHPVPADCESHPPAVCAARPWPHNLPSRNAFYMAQAQAVFGRTHAIGDALDPTTALNFQGLTSALGLSLLHRSRLLPNPNPQDSASIRRGRALFALPSVGCAVCHTGPSLSASTFDGPGTRTQFLPVITPLRGADGHNADLVSDGFRTTFPMVVQDTVNIQFGATTVRDMWAHSALFLHDGRARSLREVIATPGHPALQPGETGFNEVDGIPNTHGATSQLTPGQIEDLIAFMMSL